MENTPKNLTYEEHQDKPPTPLIEAISRDEIKTPEQEKIEQNLGQEIVQQQIEQTRSVINDYSESSEINRDKYTASKEIDNNNEPILIHDPALIKHRVKQTMQDIQYNLSVADKTMSHIIHQPIIDQSSEVLNKTIFRSSGVLGGSILAFLGSLMYIIFVIYTGITYNFELFFIFLIAGFILGLVSEMIYKLFKNVIKHP